MVEYIMIVCKNCGEEFNPYSSDNTKKYWFCSDECYHKFYCKQYYWKNHEVQKDRVLKNYFEYRKTEDGLSGIRKRNYKANSKRRFGIEDRKEIVKKFNNKCVYCGVSKDRMIVHHVDKVGRNSDKPHNNKDNLILCCPSCHSKIHFWNQKLTMLIV